MARPNRTISLLFLLTLIGCGGNLASSNPSAQTAIRSGVVFFGDSIFGNWDLPSYFPNRPYVNGGYFGQRTDQQLARLPDVLSGKNVCSGFDGVPSTLKCGPVPPPDSVVIFLGWNNLFQEDDPQRPVQARDPRATVSDIEQMVILCKQAGVKPIIATLYRFDPAHPPSWDPTFVPEPFGTTVAVVNDGIRRVGSSHGIPVIDFEKIFAGQSGYTADGVHPVSSGYVQMHDVLQPMLQ